MTKRNILMIIGVIFIALGLIGFINDPVFGIFEVNSIHNIVHMLIGGIALAFSQKGMDPAVGGKILVAINILLIASMLIVPQGNVMGLEVNPADHLLHGPLLLAALYVGFANERKSIIPESV